MRKFFSSFIFVFISMFSNSVFAQDGQIQQPARYMLSAQMIKMQEDCSEDFQNDLRLELTVRYKLQNVSDDVLLFWKGEGSDFEPMYIGQTVSNSEDFDKPNLLSDRIGGESVALGPNWNRLRKQLDVPAPPSNSILFIKPKEFAYFESRVFLLARTAFRGMTGGDIDFDRLKKSDGVWLRTKFQVWSQNLNPRTKVSKKPLFSEILRERWQPFGYLMLENIVSEPIYLDLGILKKSGRCM